jgi:tetratricopeptide (TPR) repeat protein
MLLGLWLLICAAYTSSLSATWHLDDITKIVRNQSVHIQTVNTETLVNTVFADGSGRLYRPVPMLTFALNWYLSGSNVLSYHVVNMFIHCINATLLFLIVANLMQSPRMAGDCTQYEIYWIAFLTAAWWALNPVQTQAVTYIVQRMTSMAALFYLLGIYLYLRLKNAKPADTKMKWQAAIAGAYLLAILSKENAILFPLSILLIEVIFFRSPEPNRSRSKYWITTLAIVLLVALIGTIYFSVVRGNPLQCVDQLYSDRPFTISQRLLTQPRVLLHYLSLLIYPLPSRLSLCHDISVSTSLFKPWTTLPSILITFAMVVWCIADYKKRPLIALAALFFFVNHLVESTILPLELVFEHRNYLPSGFLFLPIAFSLVRLRHKPFVDGRIGRYLIAAAVCLPIGILCTWTFARNMVWHTERSLWENEIEKSPELARPYHNLAWGHYHPRQQYYEALALYEKALTKKANSRLETASTHNNIGRIHYLMGNYNQALQSFQLAIDTYPGLKIAEYQFVRTLMQMERWQDALKKIDLLLVENNSNPSYRKLRRIVLSKLGQI